MNNNTLYSVQHKSTNFGELALAELLRLEESHFWDLILCNMMKVNYV